MRLREAQIVKAKKALRGLKFSEEHLPGSKNPLRDENKYSESSPFCSSGRRSFKKVWGKKGEEHKKCTARKKKSSKAGLKVTVRKREGLPNNQHKAPRPLSSRKKVRGRFLGGKKSPNVGGVSHHQKEKYEIIRAIQEGLGSPQVSTQ